MGKVMKYSTPAEQWKMEFLQGVLIEGLRSRQLYEVNSLKKCWLEDKGS